MPKVKVQVTFDEELLKKIDDVTHTLHISRSALISIAVSEFVYQKKNLISCQSVYLVFRKYLPSGGYFF